MADDVECPVCNCRFSTSTINVHVEACLDNKDTCSTKDCQEKGNLKSSSRGQKQRGNSFISSTSPKTASETSIILDATCEQDVRGASTMSKKCSKAKFQAANTQHSIHDILGKRKYSNPSKQPMNEEDKKRAKFSGSSFETRSDRALGMQYMNVKTLVKGTGNCYTEDVKSDIQPTKKEKSGSSKKTVPLADQMRPTSFDDFVGQDELTGKGSSLRALLSSEKIPSFILWGPPGCGKTSLVNIIGNRCRSNSSRRFVKLSATTSSLSDVKEAVKIAKNEYSMFKKETILFVDEIHRFNKLQQDFFLPFVEDGTITFMGATTENPSFQVNSALLSRCKVIVLKKHSVESLMNILKRAVEEIGGKVLHETQEKLTSNDGGSFVSENALEALANLSDGDARSALNGLEMTLNMKKSCNETNCIEASDVFKILQRSHVLYDKKGEQHFNLISAFHKSIRGSDDNAALYWLSRMLIGGEDPLYIARRMIRIASEDIGLVDSTALPKAISAYQASHFIGMPECEVNLAHMAVYLARAPKSIEVYKAYNAAKDSILTWKGPLPGVPLHLRNAPTKLMKELGYAKGYKYNPDYSGKVEQDYLPSELTGTNYFRS